MADSFCKIMMKSETSDCEDLQLWMKANWKTSKICFSVMRDPNESPPTCWAQLMARRIVSAWEPICSHLGS